MSRAINLIQSLFGELWDDDNAAESLRQHMVRGTAGVLALRLCAAGSSFIISIVLARLLGVSEFGSYSFVLSWVRFLSALPLLGFDRLLVRELATYRTQAAWGHMRGLLCWSNGLTLIMSLGLVALFMGLWPLFSTSRNDSAIVTFSGIWVLLPVTALASLRQSAMQGLHQAVSGLLPELLLLPVVLFIMVVTAGALMHWHLSALDALSCYTIACAAAFLFGTWLLYRAMLRNVKEAEPVYQIRKWFYSALPMFSIGGAFVVNDRVGTIVLGMLSHASAVGIFTAATRGAGVIALVTTAANMILGPTFARLHTAGNRRRLQNLLTKSTRIMTLAAVCVALPLMLFGHWFLSFFGREFTSGAVALIILCLGQIVNATFGSVSLLLVMTGHERDAAKAIGLSAALNVLLNFLLIPRWELEGAAAAAALTIFLWNGILACLVWRRLGIYPTIFGNPWHNK